jgi:hypothetical protein
LPIPRKGFMMSSSCSEERLVSSTNIFSFVRAVRSLLWADPDFFFA